MYGQKKTLLIFSLIFIFICSVKMQSSQADEFGIGQFSVNPNPFNPNQGEVTTISGVVYQLSPTSDLSSPSITIEIGDLLSFPVPSTELSVETLGDDSSAILGEWSFQATWDGTNERGEVVSPGEYTYTINLDLPNVGKDTKSGTVEVIIEN